MAFKFGQLFLFNYLQAVLVEALLIDTVTRAVLMHLAKSVAPSGNSRLHSSMN